MRAFVWAVVFAGGLAACSGKGESGGVESGTTTAGTTESDCESGQAVLRASVQVDGGGAPPAGSKFYAEDSAGTVTEASIDEFGDARMNIPADVYSVWADNAGAGLEAPPESLDVPGCGTTSVALTMYALL